MAETTFDRYGPDDRLRGLFAASLVNAGLALVLAAVPLVAGAGEEALLWSNGVTGLLIAAFAGYNAWAAWNEEARPSRWLSVANVALALWLIASPFVYDVAYVLTAANVALGLAIALLATFNAWTAGGAARRAAPIERSGF